MMSSVPVWRPTAIVLLGVILSACASKLPKGLEEALPDAPTQREVQADPAQYRGQAVRWGGEILSLHNAADSSDVEVYGRPLYSWAEPRPDGGDGVRFIARIAGFLDPAEYSPGKRLTVRGRLGDAITRPVGDYPYRYPVVEAEVYNLWPEYHPLPDPAWYRDPYYGPWGPWGGWPHRPWPYWW